MNGIVRCWCYRLNGWMESACIDMFSQCPVHMGAYIDVVHWSYNKNMTMDLEHLPLAPAHECVYDNMAQSCAYRACPTLDGRYPGGFPRAERAPCGSLFRSSSDIHNTASPSPRRSRRALVACPAGRTRSSCPIRGRVPHRGSASTAGHPHDRITFSSLAGADGSAHPVLGVIGAASPARTDSTCGRLRLHFLVFLVSARIFLATDYSGVLLPFATTATDNISNVTSLTAVPPSRSQVTAYGASLASP